MVLLAKKKVEFARRSQTVASRSWLWFLETRTVGVLQARAVTTFESNSKANNAHASLTNSCMSQHVTSVHGVVRDTDGAKTTPAEPRVHGDSVSSERSYSSSARVSRLHT